MHFQRIIITHAQNDAVIFPPFKKEDFKTVDDRIRGGSSESKITVSEDGKSIIFYGTLDSRTLGGAGFASQSVEFDNPLNYPQSKYDGIVIDIANVDTFGPHTFALNLKTTEPSYRDDGRRQSSIVYESDFTIEKPQSLWLEWDSFKPTYRGKPAEDAPALDTTHITEISLMCRSHFQKVANGPFHIKITSLKAYKPNDKPK